MQSQHLAPYATDWQRSKGQLHERNKDEFRSPYQRDRDRILHSGAFRKLAHKTQVFVFQTGDYYRSRLTHTIEVAQITRTIARALRLDEDLAEAIALGHDLGHPPYGHAGEDALSRARQRHGLNAFNHNLQTVRVLELLEERYENFDGLDLSWEALDGTIKHNGPIYEMHDSFLEDMCIARAIDPTKYACLEGQVAAIADDIAYTNHDLDDGLRSTLFDFGDLPDLQMLRHKTLPAKRRRFQLVRQTISACVHDVVHHSRTLLEEAGVRSVDDVMLYERPLIRFSGKFWEQLRELRQFLYINLYRHPDILAPRAKCEAMLETLFDIFMSHPEHMGGRWLAKMDLGADLGTTVTDYIGGMTDRYAQQAFEKLS
ncbi:MAG: dGTP triphosphohydrolase [Alphaproteobacteria bacterium]